MSKIVEDELASLREQVRLYSQRPPRDLYERTKARVVQLETAIREHKQNTWGKGPVGTAIDVTLYEVLERHGA